MPRRCGCAARPLAGPVGRFVSGKARANTVKALVITDADGRLLFCGQTAPGSIHDLTQVRQAGLVELLALIPGVTLLADAGHQGLSAQTAGAVLTPRPARGKNQLPVPPVLAAAHEAERRVHSSRQICVEHDISHLKKWRALSRHLGRRDHLDTMLRALAVLVPSRERAPRCDQPCRPPKLCRHARPGDQPPAQVNDGPRLTMHEVVSGAQLFSVPGAPGRVATAPSYRAARWCRGAAVRGSPRHAGRTGTSVTSTQLLPPKCTVLRHGYGGTGMSNWA
jgi:hypothetical protein